MQTNFDNLVQIRRSFHQIPELALKEYETHALILKIIKSFPQDYLEFKNIDSMPTALLVRVRGSNPHRTIGYRCDIDALPVTENTGLKFSSTHAGIMHACGHDLHITVALGILRHFSTSQPADNLVFFFQPAEESQSGSVLAFQSGAFTQEFQPDEFYGLHDTPLLEAGTIGCRMGTLFAGTTEVNITLSGKSGHAAYPQNAQDMVVAQAYLITQLQSIVSRNVDPIEGGVLTFGKVTSGTIRNVIAGQAVIEGTIRGLTQEMIELIQERIRVICAGVALALDCKIDVQLNQGGYFPVQNNSALTKIFIKFMRNSKNIRFEETPPAMTGEDFGFLLNQFPGTMFWLGVGPTSSLHSATFNLNEQAIQPGVNAIIAFLEDRMRKEHPSNV